MLIKATKKLLDELKVNPCEPCEVPSFFSWHANITTVNRRKAVLLVNDATKFPVLLYGLKASEFKGLHDLIIDAIRETLLAVGIHKPLVDKYMNEAGAIAYTKTDNRSVVAIMNQFVSRLPYYADELTLNSFNQISYSLHAKEYLFKVNTNYISAAELLSEFMTKFENGDVMSEEKPIVSQTAFQFMVRLALNDFDIWRRIIVPANISFFNFHFVLQDCFNWLSYHCYDFKIFDNSEQGEQIALITDDEEMLEFEEDEGTIYNETTPLRVLLPEYSRVLYSYDFSDGWLHFCELEKVIDDYPLEVPTCIDGDGDAPPEDVGGEGGFADFLDAISNKSNPHHAEMMAWGKMQKFTRFDRDKINKKLQRSLKRKR